MKYEPCSKCGGTGKQISQRNLGENLRKQREKAKIGLRTMASLLQISPPYLSDLEKGNRPWHEDRIKKFKAMCSNPF